MSFFVDVVHDVPVVVRVVGDHLGQDPLLLSVFCTHTCRNLEGRNRGEDEWERGGRRREEKRGWEGGKKGGVTGKKGRREGGGQGKNKIERGGKKRGQKGERQMDQ